jgi:YVTN family beta-propeller protein
MVSSGTRWARYAKEVAALLVLSVIVLLLLPFACVGLCTQAGWQSHENNGVGAPPSEPSQTQTVRAGSEESRPSVDPAFSEVSANSIVRTILPNYNSTLTGNFPWSVVGWQVGAPAFVPLTGDLWLPVRSVSEYGLPSPQISPAIVFDSVSNKFVKIVTQVQNTSAFLYDPVSGVLYTADYENDTVGVINPSTGAWLHPAIPVGKNPVALAENTSDTALYVANSGSGNVTVIDTATDTVEKEGIPTGPDPDGVAFDSANQSLFVSDGGEKYVRTINTTTLTLGPSLALPGTPSDVAFSSSSDSIAVTMSSYSWVTLAHPGATIVPYAYPVVGTGASPIVTTPNGTEFVVGNESGSDIVILNSSTGASVEPPLSVGSNITSIETKGVGPNIFTWDARLGTVTEVNLSTSQTLVSPTIEPEPESVAYDPLANLAFVADVFNGSVIVLNATSGVTASTSLSFGSAAQSVAFDSSLDTLYVGLADGVVAFNLATWTVSARNTSLIGGNNPLSVDSVDRVLWDANGQLGLVSLNLETLETRFTLSAKILTGFVSQDTLALDPSTHTLFALNSTSGEVESINATSGRVNSTSIAAGADAEVLAYDSADGLLYVAGTSITMISPVSGAQVGAQISLPPHVVTTGIQYDSSRQVLFVTTTLGAPDYNGTVTEVDGSTSTSGYESLETISVGELATSPVSFYLPSGQSPAYTVLWVPNVDSGTVSVISSPPQVTYLDASPNTIDLGQSTQILLAYAGGAGPDSISYGGLPAGCASANSPAVECTPVMLGSFEISAVVTDALGDSANATTSLTVGSSLSPNLTLTPGPAPVLDLGDTLSGRVTATGGTPAYSYWWDFGDGSEATGEAVSHSYEHVGVFLLQVSVIDSVGENVTESREVVVNEPPAVSISASPSNSTDVNVPLRITATVEGGTAPGVAVWKISGSVVTNVSASGNQYSVVYQWAESGTYSATFVYTDSVNTSVEQTEEITVEPALTATFTAEPSTPGTTPVVGVTIDFRAVVAGGLGPYLVSWSYGDGSHGYGLSVTHIYGEASRYSVNVSLEDSAGVLVNETLTVVISSQSSTATSGGTMGPTLGVSLFLGILIGASVAAAGLYLVARSKRRSPLPPHPYVPPESPGR